MMAMVKDQYEKITSCINYYYQPTGQHARLLPSWQNSLNNLLSTTQSSGTL